MTISPARTLLSARLCAPTTSACSAAVGVFVTALVVDQVALELDRGGSV